MPSYTMGFDPTRFLVVPKLIASVVVVPLLTLFSDLFAILGGLLVGVSMLDLTINAYMAQTLKTLTLFDITLGLWKERGLRAPHRLDRVPQGISGAGRRRRLWDRPPPRPW